MMDEPECWPLALPVSQEFIRGPGFGRSLTTGRTRRVINLAVEGRTWCKGKSADDGKCCLGKTLSLGI
ncbi:rCG63437 [Rattus norvegicus]|uniref:RCG63437 n=1 Tax=Rattus norvegicus TaxID=10116 RepID=A6HTN5_RAT|nr:rCG63437 [Rattus norvegicus]